MDPKNPKAPYPTPGPGPRLPDVDPPRSDPYPDTRPGAVPSKYPGARPGSDPAPGSRPGTDPVPGKDRLSGSGKDVSGLDAGKGSRDLAAKDLLNDQTQRREHRGRHQHRDDTITITRAEWEEASSNVSKMHEMGKRFDMDYRGRSGRAHTQAEIDAAVKAGRPFDKRELDAGMAGAGDSRPYTQAEIAAAVKAGKPLSQSALDAGFAGDAGHNFRPYTQSEIDAAAKAGKPLTQDQMDLGFRDDGHTSRPFTKAEIDAAARAGKPLAPSALEAGSGYPEGESEVVRAAREGRLPAPGVRDNSRLPDVGAHDPYPQGGSASLGTPSTGASPYPVPPKTKP